MKKNLLFIVFFLLTANLFAQEVTVKGQVEHNGVYLDGVSVLVQGTNKGTSTNKNGEYSINVKNGEVISYTLVGYQTTKITFAGQSVLNVQLAVEAIVLEETVVVGYSTQKKATLTGAISTLSGESVKERSVASLSTALQGKMPGVTVQQTSGQPGADGANIRIRGIGSINSNTFPLVLVDGIEMDINQVDMNSVESISVLKDAASSSIYGSRASNGVVLITTKRGKEGKIVTTYSGYSTLQKPTNMPEVVSAYEYLQAELDAMDNAGISVSPAQREQQLKLIEDQRTLKPDNWNRYDTDWKAETMKDFAIMQNHNLSLAGGSDKLSFFGSGTYMHQDGLIPNNNFNRFNIVLNADAKILPWMKFGMNTILRDAKTLEPSISSPKSIINKSLYMLPTLSAARELDGNWGYGKNGDNPTAQANAEGEDRNRSSERVLSGTLTLTPLEGLEIIGQYSNRSVQGRNRNLIVPYKTSLKGTVLGIYPGQDNLTESWSENIRNYYRTQASYEKSIDQHYAKILVGFQAEDHTSTSFFGSRRGFDLSRYYLNNGDGATATAGGGASNWAMQSGYARLNYTFDDKYLFEATGRYDGSSRFTPSNRWGFFPSVSGGWVVSKESFMESTSDVIDFLKIRASYGLLGNQDIGNYPYTATINTGYGYYLGDGKELAAGVAQTNLSNSNISWEKSEQINVGLDLNLFKNKLQLTADYYVKNIYDMLMTFPLPYYAGMQPAYSNAGDMENKGWEVALTYNNKINDFKYGVTLSLNDNRNKITNLNGLNSQDRTMVEGYPNNGLWGYLTDGYFQDWDDVATSPKLSASARPGFVKYKKIHEGEGVDPLLIDSRDLVYLGDPFPHYEFGVNFNFAYKNFDLSAFIQGVGERAAYMSGVGLKPFANGSNLFRHQIDYWTPENPNAAYPILVPEANSGDNFARSDKWIQDGSYARLKNVILGYNLPQNKLAKLGLNNLRVYVSGQNLFTRSNFFSGYDPEVSYGGGVGGEFYPIMQTYTFGLDFKF
ncbi:SusC/RagA family TonB-linked outer membrane protein [Sphingobacterium bovistauri]|uniref:TonB-dependent receptor n=1 Tax=Sphingobacterium bovistauri TaxID=2781959 RepID=A0ABS7Z6A6_9SPHI|nr:TonB-dependent receptor [Sphingobacterium bovistauri]MCA5004390.1 TonB-dependent receptor [Sphingobacterium bovistauri]